MTMSASHDTDRDTRCERACICPALGSRGTSWEMAVAIRHLHHAAGYAAVAPRKALSVVTTDVPGVASSTPA